MKIKKIITTLLSFGTLALLSCKSESIIYTGKFQDQDYTLTSIETKGPSTNSINHKLKFGRYSPVMIDALSTNLSVPYSDDVFNDSLYTKLPVPQTPYMNDLKYDRSTSTVLYFSEKIFSKEVFEKYKELMLSEWSVIDKKFVRIGYTFPRIVAIVYGNDENFTLTFKGNYENKPYLLTVGPDGVIKFYIDDDKRNYEYSGLSERIQMPNKIILLKIDKEARLSKKDLLLFKDSKGKILSDYFTIKEN